MKGNHLSTQKVLAIGDALGNLDSLATLVVNDFVGSPFAILVAAFLDLEPAVTHTAVGSGVDHLLEVCHDGALWGFLSVIIDDSPKGRYGPCGWHPSHR